MIRAFVVTVAEILAQQSLSLNPLDYDNDAKRSNLERRAAEARTRAMQHAAVADRLEKEASNLPPNRTYLGGDQ